MTRRVEGLAPEFRPVVMAVARLGWLIAASVLLTACGGGGSDGGSGGTSNVAPVASFTTTPSSGAAPLVVSFNGLASSDSDGTISSYAWNFGDGTTGSGVSTSHTYAAVGTYTITLTVTDDDGAASSATRTVTAAAPNQAPTSSFLYSPNGGSAPLVTTFDGTPSSDPEGPIAAYDWNFGDGTSGTGSAPVHTFTTAGTFTVTLTVTDSGGLTASSSQAITVTSGSGGGNVTVSGTITYERVPFSSDLSKGLDYVNTVAMPAREIVVELLNASSQAVIASTTTDSAGQYAFSTAPSTSVIVRAKAQTRRTSPGWDVRVLNNTNSNALYVLDTAAFNTGTASQTKNLLADSGWAGLGGTSYTSTRAAAPFAILDTMYAAVQFLLNNGSSTLNLPALDVYWSPQNASTGNWNPATGAIETTAYRPDVTSGFPPGIYVLGLQNNDTDEYDQHVLAHEFQHFVEDKLSRADTMGGPHSPGLRLDMRIAFSEGFGNAFSAMVLGNPRYSDSTGSQQGSRYTFDMESNVSSPAGWYNEGTVAQVVWDLFDAANDDGVSVGYQPMYDAFVNQLKSGTPLTSIFPFAAALKARTGAPVAAIDALLTSRGINGTDAYASAETNSGGIAEALPVYTALSLGGTQRVCGSATAGSYNMLGNRRFLKFSLAAATSVTIRAVYTSTGSTLPFSPTPDPDIVLSKGPQVAIADSSTANSETLGPQSLTAGDYVIEVYEYSHLDQSTGASRRGVTCFNVSLQ